MELINKFFFFVMKIKVNRLKNNPIIFPEMDQSLGNNINGPSLICVPKWIPNPLGCYYLYFAAHNGSYIRLAYADDLEGPWHIYKSGSLQLRDSFFPTELSPQIAKYAIPHIASPDVHIHEESQEIYMYYHGLQLDLRQMSRIARSKDGIHFVAEPEIISLSYLRVFNYDGLYYGMAMPGILFRSRNGINNFERGPSLFNHNMRHSALRVDKDILQIFWTQVGDCPERILLSIVDLTEDWLDWKASTPIDVLFPEKEWEGGYLSPEPSVRGSINESVCQLRDPAIYQEEERIFLLYSIAGESGIAIAELKIN